MLFNDNWGAQTIGIAVDERSDMLFDDNWEVQTIGIAVDEWKRWAISHTIPWALRHANCWYPSRSGSTKWSDAILDNNWGKQAIAIAVDKWKGWAFWLAIQRALQRAQRCGTHRWAIQGTIQQLRCINHWRSRQHEEAVSIPMCYSTSIVARKLWG